MTVTQRDFLLDLIDDLLREHEEHAQHFAEPVDVIELNCPDYYNYSTEPMDLQTMKQKLEKGCYAFARDFQIHVDLMIANAIQFNGMESVVAKHGIRLGNVLNRYMKAFPKPE